VRIVAGRHAGRHLTSPGPKVRPTPEEVRARALDLVSEDLDGARFLDLFAGSGAVGQLWMFWVAPIIGALIGGVIYRWLGDDETGCPISSGSARANR